MLNKKTTRTRKPKAVSLILECTCGKKWTGIWKSGIVKKTAKCPSCLNHIRTDGSHLRRTPHECPGCQRPYVTSKPRACTYCGRGVHE